MVARGILLVLLAVTAAEGQIASVSLPARGPTVRIAVVGDVGQGADRVAVGVAAVHRAKALDAIVLPGDNFYPCGVTSERDPRWSIVRPLTTLGIPLYPVLGNHDFCGTSNPDAQLKATGVVPNWTFPAKHFVVRSPVADIAFLDTTPLAKGQRSTAETAMRHAFDQSTTPWRIVVGHHTIVSSGYHGYFPREEVRRMRTLLPAMRQLGVALYVCGHDHHQELIRAKPSFLVSGAGSSPILPVALRQRTVFPTAIERERIGFAVLEITPTTMTVRFHDEAGKPRSEPLEAADWTARRSHP